ncbi:aryl-alcohol dehydrogenase-like predicted oxidoreductase [Psychrobacter sp. PL15]|uniref:aldo/keto reductase n=1 Tax=Psychrobacter sp. PL15 TaxID=3071719 RepID=UPI002DFFE425|nr:aryl-alcohol dehydrogenase-like predicted oxidoreductase [Psychrobacter sp. PL15]
MSPIVFGSMRMSQDKGDEEYWAELLRQAYHAGIDTIHSSMEYDSFTLLQSTLQRLSKIDNSIHFKHIVKLAEPHFSNDEYSSNRLNEKVNSYLEALQVDKLEAIQWMWRSNLSDQKRVVNFTKQSKQIKEGIDSLKRKGLIETALCFPYSVEFMRKALKLKVFDDFCVYRNPIEQEYDEILSNCKKGTAVSIRPFFADKAFVVKEGPIKLLEYNFSEPAIRSTILSISSLSQLNEIKGFLNAKASF